MSIAFLESELAKVEDELLCVKGKLSYLKGQQDQLAIVREHYKEQSDRRKDQELSNRKDRERRNPHITDAIYRVVEASPGRYKLACLARKVADEMGIEGNRDRARVYNIAHGMKRREQFVVNEHTKKIYPSFGKWSAYRLRKSRLLAC